MRAGLDEPTIAQVVGLSLATNWLGYGLLAGVLFATGAIAPPAQAHLAARTFRALGVLMVLAPVVCVAACAQWKGREWRVSGRRIRLLSARLAVVQLVLSAANWSLMGAAMYLLLERVASAQEHAPATDHGLPRVSHQ
jgi:uncharacterized membrane protein YbhN (UPF0104 family)